MKLKDKFNELAINVVRVFFGVFVLLYFVLCSFFSVHINNLIDKFAVEYNFGINIYVIIILSILIFIFYFLIKNNFFNISEKKLLFIFLLISLVIGSIWIFSNNQALSEGDDAQNCFNTAIYFINGEYSKLKHASYIAVHPNNIGLVLYDALNILVFGETGALYSIRLINLVVVMIGYYYLYKICDLMFEHNRLINCSMIFLMFGSMQFVFYSYFVYGNCLSYSLGMVSIYYLLNYFKDNKYRYLIMSIITILLSIFIKNNSLIILIAEIIYYAINIVNTKKFKLIICVLALILGSVASTSGVESIFENIIDYSYEHEKLPTITWLAYGVNYDINNPGHYTNQIEVFHESNGFKAEYTKLEAERFFNDSISYFKNNPLSAINFYIRKFLVSWANPQFEAFGQFRYSNNSYFTKQIIGGTVNHLLDVIWDCVQIILAIGLLIFIIKGIKGISIYQLLCATIVVGGFLFHIVWEVKAIYLYQYYMYLLPYGAHGLIMLFNKGKEV